MRTRSDKEDAAPTHKRTWGHCWTERRSLNPPNLTPGARTSTRIDADAVVIEPLTW